MKKKIYLTLIINFLLFAAFSVFVAEISAQKKPSDKAKKLAKQGEQFFAQKDYRSALNKYAEAVAASPFFPDAHFWKGYAHYYLNEYDRAIEDMDFAAAQGYKPLSEIYKLRWYLHYEKKNYDLALKDLQELLKTAPTDKTYNLGLANIYRGQGAYKEAIEVYKKIAETDPNNADVYYFMALSYAKTGDFENQAAMAAEAAKRNSQFVGESFFLLAEALQKTKKYDEAIRAYERVINVKPDSLQAYVNLAEIYRLQNRYDDAIATVRKALRAFPNNGDLYLSLSYFYSFDNRHNEAATAAQNAIRLMPNQAAGFTNLCRAYNDLKQYQQAIFACNDALKINPNDGETFLYLGRAYDLLKKQNDAAKAYAKAVEGLTAYTLGNPEHSEGFYLLGNALYANNQTEKAIEAFRKSLQLSPNFAKARYNLGVLLSLNKDANGAREQYNALVKIDKDLAEKLRQTIEKK